MNFDNDGKDFKISADQGQDFLVSVKVNNTFFPSIGINKNGIFVSDLLVDSNGEGKYKRQNENRWITSKLIKYVMEEATSIDDIRNTLCRVEIVNAPNSSTHNLIVDQYGNTCVVEPGRRNIFTGVHDSDWYVMTNFPLSDYQEIVPAKAKGMGSDRYQKILDKMTMLSGPMTIEQGFALLESVKQDGPEWITELSIIYNGVNRVLYYCLDQNFDKIVLYDINSRNTIQKKH
ncbi:MAG: linear amide C-N hydrolase [Anaerolineales bacterium]|jgi:hypothetical protein